MALLPLNEALANMLAQLPTPTETETLSLNQAANRVLAQDIISPINVPNFDNSAMDGYAIKLADLDQFSTFTIAGKAFAGKPFEGEIKSGECVRIMTGAMLPTDCDAVIMQEETEQAGENQIKFTNSIKLGQNIRRVGEDVAKGSLVLAKGSLLNVASLPLLASLGIAKVEVFKRTKVAILSTGDELVSVGKPLSTGQIYDTNRFAVRLMLEKLNCEILDFGILPDDPTIFEETFVKAQQAADVLITSGGVSVGEADFTKDVLEKLGKIAFWKIAIKPGKPFAFGFLGESEKQTVFFGLPGNPVSALVTFYQLVQPALARLSGLNDDYLANLTPKMTACAATNLKKAAGRQDFQRGFYFINEQGELMVKPVGQQGSHIFSAFYESNCFIVLEAERGNVQAGEKVTIQPFNGLLR
ncbi:molybdopterin molybdotransferase MoeA [Haemophilus parahaemolyticus]|uniref:Molybdopterin molybdenumtransferase n=2 Tax=Haemophilus parahaemolyticus TaxID=735 RepID=A0AAE6JS37_HAEPH|nr:molybdopterin molybdotransferase MoeA [Haemophilus parahaemolyticus]EIJ69629.1 MoeA N-terminal region (domain I and II) [Haemophilus parahaemolyticus HK385]OOR96905.1 molybdopterin molybdenumtransferase MoeA [Haemophilus parahaemolyticus]QEN10391.1 molybdopterin molybdotransferase MoeA [Haemophilus parahaemolyticus]QRP13378.1 molybdopterin molybdotransferase MoeA [Haemophilus parahaemolyticus]STO65746.1 molybdopterin biosynthesis protein MoeA [Haemophilus parahaemolyticus HK385]